MESTNNFSITIEANEVINYALQQNGVPVIREIYLKNHTECDKRNLFMQITTDIPLLANFEQGIEIIQAGVELHLDNLNILIRGEYLASLTEKITCILIVRIYENNKIIAEENKKIQVLAYDEWPGLRYFPDLLVAFVTPNHPFVKEIIHSASKYLEQWTENPSLDGYQNNDPNRVIFMAAAVYAAIQKKNIVYAVPPSSFEEIGQRVRLCDTIKEQGMGTCLDLTLLYVACLQAMGLNPIMILLKGHIFAGVWTQEKNFADSIIDDPTQIEKRMSDGIHELLVVECTTMCAGKVISFDEARQIARNSIAEYYNFVFAIDVTRSIVSGVTPIPIRIKTETGYRIENQERKNEFGAPKLVEETFSFDQLRKVEQVNKLTQWEHKLLDLSLRNMLINMRLTKSVVPLLSGSLSDLEDALADGEEFQVLPRPLEWERSNITQFSLENTNRLDSYADLIRLECRHKRLHTIYTEKELNSILTKLYRSAKTSMEENGASTLYLALGLLRWVESKQRAQSHYAPLVLLPVEIERKSASKGFVLCMRDEDPQINITLLELLKRDFDIVINGLNPIPRDDHGIDMTKIFAIIRHAIMDEPMWEVIESGFIGNFSFSQFVMWNDIHSRPDFLSRNKIVRSLMEGVVDWDDTISCKLEDEGIYVPVAADASQLHAINMAAHDISFVLHGPPGTGKSQTITAMIANALAKRKTVLFVAEKLVALQVVEKRLNALGIGNFCLELHSNKANKKDVIKQLKKVLEMKGINHLADFENKIDEIQSIKKQLDGYVKELHCKRKCGYSLKELIDFYEELPEIETIRFDRHTAMNLTKTDLENQQHLLEQLVSAGKAIHHPHNHPLTKVKQTQYSMSLKLDLADVIESYRESIIDLRNSITEYAKLMKVDFPVSKKQIDQVLNETMDLMELSVVPDFLLSEASMEEEFKVLLDYLNKRDNFEKHKNEVLSLWDENFLYLSMEDMEQEFTNASKKLFGKNRALNTLLLKLQSYAKFEIKLESIPVLLTKIKLFQKDEQNLIALRKKIPDYCNSLLEEYSSENKMLEYKKCVQSILAKNIHLVEKIKDKFSTQLIDKIKELQECKTAYDEIEEKTNLMLMPEFTDDETNWFEEHLEFCDTILKNSADLKEWTIYQKIVFECQNAGLGQVCRIYEKGLQHKHIIDTYKKGIYQSIIYSIIEQVPILNNFTGSSFNEKISQFKIMDENFTELTKKEIYCKLIENLPSSTESNQISKELNILRRAIASNGRGMSIRSLFDQIPNIIFRLCPCILMSPISVAQYFPADSILYDIVIFDEASQLPTCKAIGVLARAKNAVIVGDPNQMPPTSFFAGNTIDEDNLDIEDLDSILDDCLALGMPQAYLKWHYRSRHESLIAFSNHEFYDNKMFTFPSNNDRECRVSLKKIDGYFDRGKSRQNIEEAKAIVQEILNRYYDEKLKEQSIGVVTFNINQESLIKDLLQEEFQKNSAFDAWANDVDEELIVKNLENIQGDERDVILFSIAFGPDSEGKLSMNFGPINKEGGWKRLNVAISRARYEMIVFSTMQAKDIDLSRTKSVGVKALKNFLEFADNGKLSFTSFEQQPELGYGELHQICLEIEKMGYQYQTNVGKSEFKVDIAVIDPYHPKEYLLGILLDGVTYKNAKNTRDREVSQIDVLKGLGWEIHRIWTMDWWDNKDKEIAKLKQLLHDKEQYAKSLSVKRPSKIIITEENANKVEEYPMLLKDSLDKEEVVNRNEIPFEIKEMITQKQTTDCDDVVKEKEQSKLIDKLQTETSNNKFSKSNTHNEDIAINLANHKNDIVNDKILKTNQSQGLYTCEEYISAMLEETTITLEEYASRALQKNICNKIIKLIEVEAPISHNMLIKKVLNSFGIRRVTPQGTIATEKVMKKLKLKSNRQNGIKFYWRSNQNPDDYFIYRVRINEEDRKSPGDICQQELKNAICYTLQQKHSLTKEELVKETVKVMGYSRRGTALDDAVNRGYKYARKIKVVEMNENKKIQLL